jgi:hypothetical protein
MNARVWKVLAACSTLVPLGGIAAAQGPAPASSSRFEAALMAGYRFEGTITFSEFASDSEIAVGNTAVYSFTLGYKVGPVFEAELGYSYARPPGTAIARSLSETNLPLKLTIHEFQPGILAYFAPPDAVVRPYVEVLLGLSVFGDHEGISSDDTVKMTPGLSLGAKGYFSDQVGVRAEIHYTPMFLYTTADSTELCIEDNLICWDVGGRYLQQVDVRAGVTFRF